MSVPKVSCICVTRNRRLFLRQAVHYYHRAAAHYSRLFDGSTELVVVDGSDDPCTVPERSYWDRYVRYIYRPTDIMRAGLSHNIACEEATGEIIIQWDDDDWQHPERIVRQVKTLLTADGDGFAFTSEFYWYHIEQKRACRSKSWGQGAGSMGATFAYWRDTWSQTPFQDIGSGEDVPFQHELNLRGCPMLDAKDPELLVYMRHNQNGSSLTNYNWRDDDTEAARRLMLTDCDFYDGIGELLPIVNWNHPNAPGSKVHVMNPLKQLWARHHR